MIQKRSRSLSTEVNRPFYDMVEILVVIIFKMLFFTICGTLFRSVIKVLPITHRNKSKMSASYINYIQAIWV